MELRYYQAAAKEAIYNALESDESCNPCAVLPTGSGKTPLLSKICQDVAGKWGGRVLVLAHVKELLEQAAEKLQHFLPDNMVGIYSAGLNRRDTDKQVICAGIQSVYKRAGELGAFSCIIVDEAHLIPAHDGGMYRTFIESARVVNPRVRVIGLTATPYRMDCGWICDDDNILTSIAYEVGVRELIARGYLCHIKTRAGKEHPDLAGIPIRGGEYIVPKMAERMSDIVESACVEIVELTRDRHSVLIFASSLEHGRKIQERIAQLSCVEVGFVCGDTPAAERAELLARFKRSDIKFIVNMNVLTTGFDAPNVDAVVLMRATLSPGLYYQMVGRGLRVDESKDDCIILDYGENTIRHGAIDMMEIKEKKKGDEPGEAPAKECPECQAVVFAGVARCPECGFEFPPPEVKHKSKAGKAGVLSGEVTTTEHTIERTRYYIHEKRNNPDAPKTMRVEYEAAGLYSTIHKEWVCFSHEGFARQRAENWWRDRSNLPVPKTTEEAVRLADAGALAKTNKIIWREVSGEKYGSIIGWDIDDEKPCAVDCAEADRIAQEDAAEWGVGEDDWWGDDDVPF